MSAEIRYGKAEIPVHRLRGDDLLSARVSIEVFGDNFMPAYTEGDNRNVVPTDTMKNFVHAMAIEYPGAAQEGLAIFVARRLLDSYAQMHSLRVTCEEVPFARWGPTVYSAERADHGLAIVEMDRQGRLEMECGRLDVRLLKTTGSAFAGFPRDEYTTLPERGDRPLFIYLDVRWRYLDAAPIEAEPDGPATIASAQVAEEVREIFRDFTSRSIQHLVHEMGIRLLARHPSLAEVSFEAQNRLWDTVAEGRGEPRTVVYSDPRPAHGSIGLRLRRPSP